MSTGFVIKSVANPKTGSALSIVLDGTPTGTLTFFAGRTPNFALASPAAATSAAGIYTVSVPHPSLWYIWASDTNGVVDAPGCGWAGLSDNPDLDLIGQFLTQTLRDNQPALNIALASYLPGLSLKQIVYGGGTGVTDFPCIMVVKPHEDPEWAAMPFVRRISFRFEIMLTILHQDKAPMLPAMSRFLARVMEILNQPAYEGPTLESGTALAFCQCQDGEGDEVQYDDNKFAAVGSLVWSGSAMLQDSA